MRKLNHLRASFYMAGRFKELRPDIKRLAAHRNFAGVLQLLINHLLALHAEGAFSRVSQRIAFLGRIYQRGNAYVQYIIANLFVRSLKSLEKKSTPADWQVIYHKLPTPFMALYDQQNRGYIN